MTFTILCDFDGTITRADTADAVFNAFADPAWRDVEALWEAGEIGSAECMRRQMELVDASYPQLHDLLDSLEIDPAFPAFSEFCARNGISLTIVSDGIDYFIHRILGRYGLSRLPVKANRLVHLGGRHFSLSHPNSVKDCASGAGACKCSIEAAQAFRGTTILIGDGRSDFCVAQEADLVFAKKSLLQHVQEQGIAAHEFSTFSDVQNMIEEFIAAVPPAFVNSRTGLNA